MKCLKLSNKTDRLALVVWVLLLIAYLVNLTGWQVHDDEGEYLYQVWRMTLGEVPYRDFLTPQLPVFLYAGRFVMSLAGSSLVVMRFYNVLLVFLSAGLIYLAGRKHAKRPRVGLLAMALFLLHPDVFKECRIFRNEPLMLFLAVAGLVTATWPLSKYRRRKLAIAGFFCGLATLSKLFGLFPAVGIALWITWDAWRYRKSMGELIRDGLAFGVPILSVVIIVAGSFTLIIPEFFDLVVGHHLAQGGGLSVTEVAEDKLALYWEYLGFYPVLVPLALISAVSGFLQRDKRRRWAWQIPVVLGFLVLSRGLGRRHFMFLLPSLSILSAWLLMDGFSARGRWWLQLVSGVALLAILVPALDANIFRIQWSDNDTATIVEIIEQETSPGDVILADDIGLAFYSRRPTTYSGAALSHGAITSGQISGDLLIDEIVQTNVRLIVLDQSLLTANHMVYLRDYPRFHRFLERNYELVGRFERDYQELDIWLRDQQHAFQIDDEFTIDNKDGTRFGDTMQLLGFTFQESELSPGEQVEFTLFWTADAPADNYWSVFTHFVNSSGEIVAQADKVPYNGLYPPNRWWPGQIVDDDYTILLPEDLPPGDYRLAIGMYDWQTGERLSLWTIEGEPIQDNRLSLDYTIIVDSPQ